MLRGNWTEVFDTVIDAESYLGFKLPFTSGDGWIESDFNTYHIHFGQTGRIRVHVWDGTETRAKLAQILGLPVHRIEC